MPIIILQPGTVARADDVNKNFQYVLNLIGPTSDPDSFKPPKIKLGPQQNFVLSAEHNIQGGANNFGFIGHNVEMIQVGNNWEYRRINDNSSPSAIEFGDGALRFRTTDRSAGQLNTASNWPISMSIINTTTENYIMMEKRYQIKNTETTSRAQSVMRNTVTFLDTPVTIFEGASLGSGIKVYQASSFSTKIPADCTGVVVYCALSSSGSSRWFAYPHGKDRRYGGSWSAHGGYRSSGSQQIVPLSSDGKFVLDREGSGYNAHLYIIGYLG